MISVSNRNVRFVLAGVAVLVLGKVAWTHRNDDWVRDLLHPAGPAKVNIKFDNGSVRDSTDTGRTVKSEVGQLKKCLLKGKVTYTDQECPIGAQVVAVNGGTVTVLDSPKPQIKDASAGQTGKRSLRDALDISGGESLKDKMMERVIKQ